MLIFGFKEKKRFNMKKNYSIRLHDEVLKKIKEQYGTLQNFINKCTEEKIGTTKLVVVPAKKK